MGAYQPTAISPQLMHTQQLVASPQPTFSSPVPLSHKVSYLGKLGIRYWWMKYCITNPSTFHHFSHDGSIEAPLTDFLLWFLAAACCTFDSLVPLPLPLNLIGATGANESVQLSRKLQPASEHARHSRPIPSWWPINGSDYHATCGKGLCRVWICEILSISSGKMTWFTYACKFHTRGVLSILYSYAVHGWHLDILVW